MLENDHESSDDDIEGIITTKRTVRSPSSYTTPMKGHINRSKLINQSLIASKLSNLSRPKVGRTPGTGNVTGVGMSGGSGSTFLFPTSAKRSTTPARIGLQHVINKKYENTATLNSTIMTTSVAKGRYREYQ